MAGLTDTGFERKTQAEMVEELLDEERAKIAATLSNDPETYIGSLNNIIADQGADVWEVAEEAINAFDPENNTGSRAVATALLTGISRKPAQLGLATATVNLDAAKTFAPGTMVANVFDQPGNRWTNRDIVQSTSPGNYEAVFVSETPGALAVASASQLTVIADGGQEGWNSITNAADATPGRDEETIDELKLRREDSLAASGSTTTDAIQAKLQAVEEVIQALVEENAADEPVEGLPAHSLRAVIWDGSPAAADDDEIAQIIYDNKGAGIEPQGSESGTARNVLGAQRTVAFQRAEVIDVYFAVEIESEVGVRAEDVKAAILSKMPNQMGEEVLFKATSASVFTVAGVDTWVTFTLGTTASPTGTDDITVGNTQIAISDSSKITVTGDAT